MSVDVSVTASKERAAKYAASFEPSYGDAGFSLTRRSPVALTDRQTTMLRDFVIKYLQGMEARRAFQSAVYSRLSGSPGDAALKAAIVNSASEIGFSQATLSALGLIVKVDRKMTLGRSKEAQRDALL
jgi:hypothetical protein